jgi:hypothetical protein
MKMKLTKLEINFLNQILKSEFLEWIDEEDFLGDWVCEPDYDMKITRGIIASLIKKDVIKNGGNQKGFAGQEMIWVSIKPKFVDIKNQKLNL